MVCHGVCVTVCVYVCVRLTANHSDVLVHLVVTQAHTLLPSGLAAPPDVVLCTQYEDISL